jgi:hypothetical protein
MCTPVAWLLSYTVVATVSCNNDGLAVNSSMLWDRAPCRAAWNDGNIIWAVLDPGPQLYRWTMLPGGLFERTRVAPFPAPVQALVHADSGRVTWTKNARTLCCAALLPNAQISTPACISHNFPSRNVIAVQDGLVCFADTDWRGPCCAAASIRLE